MLYYAHSSGNHLVDGVVLWKMHGRLSGTNSLRLHGCERYTRVGTETIALDDFRFTMVIQTGQYASFDMISFIIMFY